MSAAPHPPSDPPLLELRGIKAAYGRIEVVHGIDLVVPQGKVVAILGPNGAGKSTTLKVACGLLAADRRRAVRRRAARQRRQARGARPRRPVPHPRGQGHLPEPHRAREPAHVDVHGPVAARRSRRSRTRGSRGSASAARSSRARCPAASSRCSRCHAGSPPIRRSSCSTSCRWGSRRSSSRSCTRSSRTSRSEGVSILVVEQFAQTVLGVADEAVIMVHGEITSVGHAGRAGRAAVARPTSAASNRFRARPTASRYGREIMSQTQEQAVDRAGSRVGAQGDDRVARFRADVADMHLRDPRAGRERLWMFIGGALMVIGVVLAIVAYFQSSGATAAYNTEGPATQRDAITIALDRRVGHGASVRRSSCATRSRSSSASGSPA